MKNNKIYSTVTRAFGWFLLAGVIYFLVLFIIEFNINKSSLEIIILSLIFILPISLWMITQYYTYDNEKITYHCCFFKKDLCLHKIIEIKYSFFGLFYITLYGDTLKTKHRIILMLFCNKNRSIKKMEGFLEVLAKKNISCVIVI